MQKKHIWQLFLSSRLISSNNFIILGIGCLILVMQIYWFWGPTQMAKVTNYENTNWKLIKGNKTKEECLNLLPGQKLEYSFKSSAEVLFNIYYHEQGGGPIYLMDEKGTVFNKGVLEPTKKDRYCLSWRNYGMQDVHLSYNTQLLPLFEDQIKTRVPVNYRVSGDKQSIRIVSDSGEELTRLKIGSNILNFQLNNNSKIMAISVSDLKETLLIYDLMTLQINKKYEIKSFPRFLEFSTDNRYLIVGNEHTTDIIRINLKNNRMVSLTLPLLPIALMIGEKTGELFVRAEKEVMKIQLEPLKLIERNARIEFTFGEETILADPDEFCTVHGVPHPLFTPLEESMSTEGLQGFYFQKNEKQ